MSPLELKTKAIQTKLNESKFGTDDAKELININFNLIKALERLSAQSGYMSEVVDYYLKGNTGDVKGH